VPTIEAAMCDMLITLSTLNINPCFVHRLILVMHIDRIKVIRFGSKISP